MLRRRAAAPVVDHDVHALRVAALDGLGRLHPRAQQHALALAHAGVASRLRGAAGAGHHAAALRAAPPAPEHVQERLAEAGVHEAVRDGVAAARAVGQQLEEADARVAEARVDGPVVEQGDRVDHVQRRPAQEELEHQHEQHLDHALLAQQVLFGVGAPQDVAAVRVLLLQGARPPAPARSRRRVPPRARVPVQPHVHLVVTCNTHGCIVHYF